MVTLRADGTPHVVRVVVALVDGKIWSSGTQSRVRTSHLRRDPRSTLFVFENEWRWLGLECTVTILDGPDAPELNLRLFQVMQRQMAPASGSDKLVWMGQEKSPEEFLRTMVEERRLIYEFGYRSRVRHVWGDTGPLLVRTFSEEHQDVRTDHLRKERRRRHDYAESPGAHERLYAPYARRVAGCAYKRPHRR